ncbi:C2H2-type zinc finger protein [Candidatus Sororendozoicomonas aggregata]|uniref:C2H2-type zinc finger protein n=1 Tax=Candidatus Sororendozoicomonas aggregata TaxID=3073239 RepID=UPI002ED66E86
MSNFVLLVLFLCQLAVAAEGEGEVNVIHCEVDGALLQCQWKNATDEGALGAWRESCRAVIDNVNLSVVSIHQDEEESNYFVVGNKSGNKLTPHLAVQSVLDSGATVYDSAQLLTEGSDKMIDYELISPTIPPDKPGKIEPLFNGELLSEEGGISDHHVVFLCQQCLKRFHMLKEFEAHRITCNETKHTDADDNQPPEKKHSVKEEPYACAEAGCYRSFSSKNGLIQHKRHAHIIAYQENLKCKECGRVFVKMAQLDKHMRSRHASAIQKLFKCPEMKCDKAFSEQWLLRRHQNALHTTNEQKVFKCPEMECDKAFSQQWRLRRHQKALHATDEQKIFKCAKCDKAYALKDSLNKHKQRAHPKNRERFKCDKCVKAFPLKGQLQRHQRECHDKKKKYPCDECDKTFAQTRYLTQHKRETHAKEEKKIYRCTQCDKVFPSPRRMNQHKRRRHGLVK